MKVLDAAALRDFIEVGTVLYGSPSQPGIMLTPQDEIVKFFYVRKRVSTSTFFPQAKQFTRNSRKLRELDIPAPVVKEVGYCPEKSIHMVIYDRLPGADFREHMAEGNIELLTLLPGYLAGLHDEGVYFRAIHLGNILYHEASISLLDISDLKVVTRPLRVFERARNIAHLINAQDDKAYIISFGIHRFVSSYIDLAGFGETRRRLFVKRLELALDADMRDQFRAGQ